MQQPIIFSIEEDGTSRFLVNEATKSFVQEQSTVQRASHVEPSNLVLRGIFHALRRVFGEHGKVADLTRQWKCRWRINLGPINGAILPGVWYNRQDAINEEIKYLQENWL